MHWRSYLTWAAFRLGAHHTPSDYWGQGSYPMGYWHGQRDKWRCLSGAIWQCNSSYLLLVLKGGVKRNTILYLAGSACAFQIRGMFGCTTSWKSALKMILGDICWFCDLSSMQLWFPLRSARKEFSKLWFGKCIRFFFSFIEFGNKHPQTLYSMWGMYSWLLPLVCDIWHKMDHYSPFIYAVVPRSIIVAFFPLLFCWEWNPASGMLSRYSTTV